MCLLILRMIEIEEESIEKFNCELKEVENELLALKEATSLFNKLIASSGDALHTCESTSQKALVKLTKGTSILKKVCTTQVNSMGSSTSILLVPIAIGAAAGGPIGAAIAVNTVTILGGMLTGGAVGAAGSLYLRSKLS